MKNTDKEKANEIGKKHARQYHHNTFEGGLKNNEFVFSDEECMKSALEMAEWKDQQFAEQKQQLIKKACEWLELNTQCGVHPQSSRRLISEFKKAMEE